MKKKLAMLLVFVLVFSMATPVFASLPTPGDIVGEGTINDAEWPEELLSAAIPTTGNLNFTIDPFGHLTLVPGDTIDLENRTNEIVFTTPYFGITNSSSVDVIVNVALSLTNEDNDDTPDGVIVVATEALVAPTGNTANNVLFWLEPNRELLKTPAGDAADNFVGVGRVIPMPASDGTTATNVAFRLAPIPTNVVVDTVSPLTLERVPATANDRNGTAVRVGGIFNQNADWSDASAIDLRVRAIFSVVEMYEDATTTILQYDSADLAYGLLGASSNLTSNISGAFVAPTHIAMPAIVAGVGAGFRSGAGISGINNNYNTDVTFSIGVRNVVGVATLTVDEGAATGTLIPFSFDDFAYAAANVFFTSALTNINQHVTVGPNGVTLSAPVWDTFTAATNSPMDVYITLGADIFHLTVIFTP